MICAREIVFGLIHIMRILVLSDIHANFPALEAVLSDAADAWDEIWCLGDSIGYGPNPNECVGKMQELASVCLIGNHDQAGLGLLDVTGFNPIARRAVEWTQAELSAETTAYLNQLDAKQVLGDFTLAHGSPRDPIWEYVLDTVTAFENLSHFETPVCFIGHSHVSLHFIFHDINGMSINPASYDSPLQLDHRRFIINPGSVGQPRDLDPRASYGILDTELMTWQARRVAYDIAETQRRILATALPPQCASRLSLGQ